MALIKVGSISSFAIAPRAEAVAQKKQLKAVSKLYEAEQVSRTVAADAFAPGLSTEARGVALKNITLHEGFEGFIANLFKATNELYFIAWAWDLSGEPVALYPGEGVAPETVLIPIKTGKLREFIGEGINLFPKRTVKGGIAIRIQVWESDQNIRKFGNTLSATAEAIQTSELNQLLSAVSLATGVSGATITLIKDAAIELAKIIGNILEANGDDYVDFFEGYYAADQPWLAQDETYKGNASSITLRKY